MTLTEYAVLGLIVAYVFERSRYKDLTPNIRRLESKTDWLIEKLGLKKEFEEAYCHKLGVDEKTFQKIDFALKEGNKILAIKILRESSQLGLKEAKELIEKELENSTTRRCS